MRQLPSFIAIFLVAALPARAQVTVDLRALQALPDHPAAPRSATVTPATVTPATVAPATVTPAPSTSVASVPAAKAARAETPVTQQPPAIPENVPAVASVQPVAPPPVPQGAPPPAPPPISKNAATVASATTVGLRLTFAAGESDLSPDSAAAIRQAVDKAPPGDTTTFNVLAYSAGKPDDPSTARRLSLSRAMAVRSVLVSNGVPSARIFVRALGDQAGDGPPDRVDLSVTGLDKAATQ